jgi:hypothetical protein
VLKSNAGRQTLVREKLGVCMELVEDQSKKSQSKHSNCSKT